MIRPSSEALLISALINLQDVEQGPALGISPEYLIGYQAEYRWLISYLASYKTQPSWAGFKSKFPDFPQQDHTDVLFAAEEIRHDHTRRLIVKAIRDAGHLVREGDIEEAYLRLGEIRLTDNKTPLRDVLVDETFLDDYGKPIETIGTTLGTLTGVTGGMRRGDLCIYAARTGVGKSWLLANQAILSAMAGLKVIYFSLEMSEEQLRSRLHAIASARLGMDVKHSELHRRTLDLLSYKKLIYKIKESVTGV